MANLYPETRVAAIAAFNADGKLLLGLRQDVNLWTCPGGHLEDGEQPVRGAIRELYEETGLVPDSLKYLGDGVVKLSDTKLLRVYCFRAEIPAGQEPTGANDPDHECEEWVWVDVALGSLPLQYDKHIAHANDVLLRYLGLQRGVVVEDVSELDQGLDSLKVILEQPGMAPCPIEGGPNYVFAMLARRFPGLETAAQPGDVEGLAAAINESGAAFVAYGEDLNAPRHRYPHEDYDPAIHDDPWPREADTEVWATTGLRKDEQSSLPHPFDYSNVPDSFQNSPTKPSYEYTSASTAKKAKFWSEHHQYKANMATDPNEEVHHQTSADLHAKNATHLATNQKPELSLEPTEKPTKPSNPWDHTAEEDLPHPFRYQNAPPGSNEDHYGGSDHHIKANVWANYHKQAASQAEMAGQAGAAEKHKALAALHDANKEHLRPECEHCNSKQHLTEDHECAKCAGNHDTAECNACDYCGSNDHESLECDEAPKDESSDEDDSDSEDERIGWQRDNRGPNKPTGPLGEQVSHQIKAHGQPEEYSVHDIPRSKYSGMDKAITRKIDDGAVHTDDLYRSYKHTPHIAPSVLLKYIVHRVNHMRDYDDSGKAERLDKDFLALHQFGGAQEKNGQLTVGHLHHMLQKNPHLVDELVHKRDLHQQAIREGIGLNTRKINGQDYVALVRALNSPKMNHEHALSSFADETPSGFGQHKHHTWVPIKDVWYSYDLGSRYPKGNHGAENEYLVSHNAEANGHRYKAQREDVQKGWFKGDEKHGPLGYDVKGNPAQNANGSHHWQDLEAPKGIDRAENAPSLATATDTDLAHHVEHHNADSGDLMRYPHKSAKVLNHPNAGPETWAAMSRKAFGENSGNIPDHWLAGRAVPAEAALAQVARAQSTPSGGEYAVEAIKNPNLSKDQVNLILGTAPSPEHFVDLARAASSNPSLAPETAGNVIRQLDQHAIAHSMNNYDANRAAEDLTERMTPADRKALLMDIAKRKFSTSGQTEHEHQTRWNLHLAKSLMARLPPEDRQEFAETVKIPKKVRDAQGSKANIVLAMAPPSDKDVADFAKVGNAYSTLLERKFTDKQLSHVLSQGERSAVSALVAKYINHTDQGDRSFIFSPEHQKQLMARPDFNVRELMVLPELTGESVATLLKKNNDSVRVNPKDRLINLKKLAANSSLTDKTIAEALPTNAREKLPFIFEKPYRHLSSAERKKVAAYKKDNPDTKDVWELLTTRNRIPASPKDHIIKPLPPGEHLAKSLRKALPGFKFPGMGIKDNRRETPILTTQQQVDNKNRATINASMNADQYGMTSTQPPLHLPKGAPRPPQFPDTPEGNQDMSIDMWNEMKRPNVRDWTRKRLGNADAMDTINGASSIIGPNTISYSKGTKLRSGNPGGGKSDVATKLHEDLHNTFKRVQNSYGMEGRKNLAQNLMSKLRLQDPEAHNALTTYFTAKLGHDPSPLATEERFTHLLNYLNDPSDRERFHRYHFGLSDTSEDGQVRSFNNAMKRAYKATLKNALQADGTWALRPSDRSKTEWDKVG